jgi:hypothetical protein
MREVWIADPTNAAKVAKMRKTIEFCRKDPEFRFWTADVADRANLCMEMHLWMDEASNNKAIVYIAGRGLKRKMREKGMSIITKDGINPVQGELDKLTAAFNAPKYAGLKEWFATWYPEYQWTDSEMATAEEIAALKDKVYYGEIPFSLRVQHTLRFYLGVDEYNKFVKEFNK